MTSATTAKARKTTTTIRKAARLFFLGHGFLVNAVDRKPFCFTKATCMYTCGLFYLLVYGNKNLSGKKYEKCESKKIMI